MSRVIVDVLLLDISKPHSLPWRLYMFFALEPAVYECVSSYIATSTEYLFHYLDILTEINLTGRKVITI